MIVRGFLLPSVVLLWSAAPQPAPPRATPSPQPAPSARPAAPQPRPTPAPTAIEGVVRGPDRKPVEKALVVVSPESSNPIRWLDAPEPPVSTRSGADGRFRLTPRKNTPQTVRVEASGLAAQVRKSVSPGASLTFDLARGGTIEGVVRDGDDGRPVPGARVEARGSNAIGLPDDPDAGRIVTQTDAEGRFKLDGIGAGMHTVAVRSRQAGHASRSNVRAGARVELLVFPAATVSGTVTGPDGKPIPRALVSVAGRPFGRNSASYAADDLGRYEIAGIEAGLYDVLARAPGLAPAVAPEVVLDERSEARVDLVLRPGARVVGRLVDANERPVAGRVEVGELNGRARPYALADSLRAEAGADGRFAIAEVPQGEHALGVNAPGQAPERVELAVRAGDKVVDVGDVRLEVGIAIRGHVRTKEGAAVPDASIQAYTMRRGATRGDARSEADGSFVLAGLEQTMYHLTVVAAGFGTAEKEAEPGGEPIDIVLEPAGIITGLVTDDRGRPVDGFRVSATLGDGTMMRRMPRFEEVSSDDGRFRLTEVSAGTYVVKVTAPERAAGTVADVKVAVGATVDVGTVKLGPGGVVRGTVVEAGGGPVAGARVNVSGQGRDWISFGTDPEVVTDGSGAFEAKGVPAGTAQVTASHPSYASSEPVSVEVEPARPTTDVRIVMTTGGRIEGSVRRRDGTPLPGMMIHANIGDAIRFSPFARNASATTGADGRFVLENVRAGRGSLTMLSPSSSGSLESGLSRELEVREGETTNVDIVLREILVSGHVTRSGASAAGMRVEAFGNRQFMIGGLPGSTPPARSSGPQRMTAVTHDDGGYEMIVDEPGTIRLSVSSADGRLRLPSRSAEVPDADAFTLDLAFAGVIVSGVVVDKETEAPVGYASVFARPMKPDATPRGGGGNAGPDGRFQIEVEPGDYMLGANFRDSDYGQAETEVRIGDSGLSDLRLALPKAVGIAGTVADAAGRGVSGIELRAVPPDDRGAAYPWSSSQSLADGSFRVTGLNPGTYTLVAQSDVGTFAVRPGVATGAKNVGLVLQPGGRVAVTVEGPDGQPVAGAWPAVSNVNGVFVGWVGRATATGPQGVTELLAPAGTVIVKVGKEKLNGFATVSVSLGETARVTVRLTESTPTR